MQFLAILASLSTLLLTASARQFSIPEVDAGSAFALSKLKNSDVHPYTGSVPPTINKASQAQPQVAGAAGSYWLESISHQGVAPFAGGGYSVFRNVRDYGATGEREQGIA